MPSNGHAHIAVLGLADQVRHARQRPLDFGIAVLAPHEALDGKNGVLGIDDGLVAGHAPDQPLAILIDRHHGRDEPFPLRRGDDDRFAAHHDRADRVRGAEIDSDDFTHS